TRDVNHSIACIRSNVERRRAFYFDLRRIIDEVSPAPGPKEVTSEQIRAVLEDLGPSSSLASEGNSSASSFCSDASLSSLQLREENALHIELKEHRYAIGKKLNEGDFVSIFKAIRTQDGTRVAVKVSNKADTKYYRMEGHSEPVPLEVRLLTLANVEPRIPQVVELLDWHQDGDQYTMVLERPPFCQTLAGFLEHKGGSVTEQLGSVIMRQIAFAASYCCLRGVFHGDINLQNIIMNRETHEIKLVGFGKGKGMRKSPHTSFKGTYSPPEFQLTGQYHGGPATAWSLGVIMFVMLCGRIPGVQDLEELDQNVWCQDGFSKECCRLLCSLLQRDPRKRLHMLKVCSHNWFKALYYKQDEPKIIAVRLSDGKKVALKFADRTDIDYISVEGHSEPYPSEVVLQIFANRGPKVSQILKLLDWEMKSDHYVMVLECPPLSENLSDFLYLYYGGSISEGIIRVIMQQTTLAAVTCCERGVLHRDIKLDNILINPYTFSIKLIDFGCGELLKSSPYSEYAGTREFIPPEFKEHGEYYGKPATVWSLGILMFCLLTGEFPSTRDLERLDDNSWTHHSSSAECCKLICSLLKRDPERRCELEDISGHAWFNSVVDEVSPAPGPKEVTSEQIRAVLEDLGPSSSLASEGNSSASSFCSDASLSSLQLREENALHIELKEHRYAIGKKLNEGDFVSIFKAIRTQDGTRVAVKVSNKADTKYYRMEGHSEPVPLEVRLLTLANVEPRIPQVVELLDWHQDGDQYTMVLERPPFCQTLAGFLEHKGGSVTEQLGSVIMRQIAFAASSCCLRGVFHGDINLQNIIMNRETHEIKLVGFGKGKGMRKSPHTSFKGTYSPPEFQLTGQYHGGPATAWSLGVIMFVMLCGRIPGVQDLEELDQNVWCQDGFSKECCRLLCSLLQRDPRKRLHMLKVCSHNWFKALYYKQDEPKIIAVRLSDGKKVALKFADRTDIDYISVEGHSEPYPSEVVLQIFANRGPKVSQILKLLDWEMKSDHYVMVLECPPLSENLSDFLYLYYGGSISEGIIRVIMQQTTLAAVTCCERGVLHRDIKLDNILINPYTFSIKLIDFGCGELLKSSPYSEYAGTREFIPPEFKEHGEYYGKPATVWSLGILMFCLLTGEFPSTRDLERLDDNSWTHHSSSAECCKLICSLLKRDPERRCELEDISGHAWFNSGIIPTGI
ncbi:hypothetical protein DNTS_010917, partial [Danionella cerebrum]